MPFHYKAFLLVMTVLPLMFVLARPVFTRLIGEADYARRRNAFLAITVAAFVLPSFWAFVAVAMLIMLHGAMRDSNPVALYALLLLVIPPVKLPIPGFGIVNYVFTLDHLRLMSLVLLLPALLRAPPPEHPPGPGRTLLRSADVLIVLYVALQVVLLFPYQSITATARNIFVQSIDLLLPYFAVTRLVTSREKMLDAMASFVLALAVIAPLAVIEAARGWILYAGLQERWGSAHMIAYVTRGELLRAQVTGGHALVLGFAGATAFGMWLYLQTALGEGVRRWHVMLALLGGLGATLARGPWLGAAVMLVVFLALGPGSFKRASRALGLLLLVGVGVMASPLGDTVVHYLPFMGEGDAASVTYRQRLAEVSWMLIQQNPVFGTPYYLAYMDELKQGEGIVDIVNTYAGIALGYGLSGLGLFVGFHLVILVQGWKAVRLTAATEPGLSLLGASLVGALTGGLVVIATVSNYLSIPNVMMLVASLLVSFVRVVADEQAGEPVTVPLGGLQPQMSR